MSSVRQREEGEETRPGLKTVMERNENKAREGEGSDPDFLSLGAPESSCKGRRQRGVGRPGLEGGKDGPKSPKVNYDRQGRIAW